MKKISVKKEKSPELTCLYPTGYFFQGEEIEIVDYEQAQDRILLNAFGVTLPEKIITKVLSTKVEAKGTWEGKEYTIVFDGWWYCMTPPDDFEGLRKALLDNCYFSEVPEDMKANVALMRDILIDFWVC